MDKADRNALIGTLGVVGLGFGFALAGSSSGVSIGGLPVFGLCVAIAFAIQWLAFAPAFVGQSEKFFDLTGGLSYIVVSSVALFLSPHMDIRSVVLWVMIVVWAGRLGWFLFQRIHKTGKDGRFDALKPSFYRFFGAWTLQGLWITFTLAAALGAITSAHSVEWGWMAWVGALVWVIGFSIEVVSDAQKNRFRSNPENHGRFIASGLWGRSRHPNYFGEIVLWSGIAMIAFPVLEGWQYVLLSSPFFVALLLIRVSGIPLLENRSDEKWGGEEAYEAYKRRTPLLWIRWRKA